MILKNHVAYRLLTDEDYVLKIVCSLFPKYKAGMGVQPSEDNMQKMKLFMLLMSSKNQKAYLVTQTILANLEMLKVKKRQDGTYDWTVFRDVKEQRMTFIMPYGACLRVSIVEDTIIFGHVTKNEDFLPFHVNRIGGQVSGSFVMKEVQLLADFLYPLLCFVFLTENDEVVMKPGEKKGTQKQGKIINSLPFPLTIINSRWNTKVTVSGAFPVRGHFSIRWTGVGREVARLVFIEPFEKKGYVRNAGSESVK